VTGKQNNRKAALMKEIEGLVDIMLQDKPAPDEIDLRDIEQAAVRTGQQIEQVLAQHLLGETEEKRDEVRCPACGNERLPEPPGGHRSGRSRIEASLLLL
jgi:hypothetical protein